MASSFQLILSFSFILLFFFVTSTSNAQPASFRPRALVLPVIKDASISQYVINLKQRTPLVSTKLVLDLGGQFLWVDCQGDYKSSTYGSVMCGSPECMKTQSGACISECYSPARPGCNNNTCGVISENTVIRSATDGEFAKDVLASISSTDGTNPGRSVSVPRFLFACASSSQLKGLASGAKGMAGLGRTRFALPLQLAAEFKFHTKFAICLPSTTAANGVVFFGESRYVMIPDDDASIALTHTPLLVNPISTASVYPKGQRSTEYFIGVKSIKVNDRAVPLNTTMLSIKWGKGGTKISTVTPYTTMETSIYNALTQAYLTASKVMKLVRVAAVAPFKFCFSSKNVGFNHVGLDVPIIDLGLQGKYEYWRMYAPNSMVHVKKDVMCLGILEGGSEPVTSIVLGAYQLEDNILQFDLKNSSLGFSSLLSRGSSCSRFNFTSHL